jgi:hypothetical protein
MPPADPIKTMGSSVPVFLVLMAICWLGMLGTMSTWIAKAPVPGRETDRLISQAYSGGFSLLLWILLAGLLLIANSKDVLPPEVGLLTWFAHPLACAGSLAAIAVLFYPGRYWAAAIPAVAPLLVTGYVLYGFFPSVRSMPMTQAGYILWAGVLVLSLLVVPGALGLMQASSSGSVEDKPGPELDRFKARERQRYRDEVLDKLRQSDDETKLYELSNLIRPDNPALPELMDFIRKMPHRQNDVIQMLSSQGSTILPFLADIDIQATPELCTAARGYLRGMVRSRLSMFHSGPENFVGMEFDEGIPGIRWISKNCGCKAELAEMAAYARQQNQDAPAVKKFLDALAELQ